MNETRDCFLRMKSAQVDIERAIDVGAYRGEFTNILESIWPKCQIQQFEADERQKQYLKNDAKIIVLSNTEEETNLYTIEDTYHGSTTGTSLYKEKTHVYRNPIVKKVLTKRLDDVVDMSGDWSKGLIKLDTQGSELMILDGAKKLLSLRPRYIHIEVSIREYNEGAPLVSEVFEYMKDISYSLIDILDRTYIDDVLYQSNFLFESQIIRKPSIEYQTSVQVNRANITGFIPTALQGNLNAQ
jgi:FkbM family methyltransferase